MRYDNAIANCAELSSQSEAEQEVIDRCPSRLAFVHEAVWAYEADLFLDTTGLRVDGRWGNI